MSLLSKKTSVGVTLIELILAMVLVSAVIMTGLSMELGLRRIYTTTDLEVQLLDEAEPIMTMISRDIMKGIGSCAIAGLSPYAVSGNSFYLYYDSNNNARRDTGGGGDTAAEYRFNPSTNILNYRKQLSGPYQELSDRVVSFNIAPPANGASAVTMTLRRIPGQGVSMINPQVTLNSSVVYRSASAN